MYTTDVVFQVFIRLVVAYTIIYFWKFFNKQ